jgi:hypothetical protein
MFLYPNCAVSATTQLAIDICHSGLGLTGTFSRLVLMEVAPKMRTMAAGESNLADNKGVRIREWL